MRYWWVNQNQTFRQELDGGYLWSPKRNKNGHRNPFYEFMREVAPGDIVFSFCRYTHRGPWHRQRLLSGEPEAGGIWYRRDELEPDRLAGRSSVAATCERNPSEGPY